MKGFGRNFPTQMINLRLPFVFVVLTFSGFCSLIYQVVWDRLVRTNFGGDHISSTIVTGTFLLGLGFGAFLFGRTFKRPFVVYAAVEAGIGAFAWISPDVLGSLSKYIANSFPGSIEDVERLRLPLVSGCILFLVPPCIFMGGTLPLMFQCFIGRANFKSSTIGWLYGINTAGAAVGTMVAPFYLLSHYPMPDVLRMLAFCNFALAGLILAAGYFENRGNVGQPPDIAPPLEKTPETALENTTPALSMGMILLIAFATGFISLSYEVSIIRHSFTVRYNDPLNFPFIVAPFLLAIGIGSALWTRFRNFSGTAAVTRIGWLIVLSSIGIWVGVDMSQQAFLGPVSTWGLSSTSEFLIYATIMAGPMPFFMSAVFPILLKLASSSRDALAGRTGRIYIVNSLGAFIGALCTQFLGYRFLGAIGVMTLLMVGTALMGIWLLYRAGARFRVPAILAMAGLLVFFGYRFQRPFTKIFHTLGWPGLAMRQHPAQIDYVEGATGTAMLTWGPQQNRADVYVNSTTMSALPDHPDHVKLESLLFGLPKRSHVLLLGLGGGGIIRELLKDPTVERIDAVDWSHELPEVLRMSRAKAHLGGALDHKKVRIWRTDARVAVFLYKNAEFDLIIDNLTIPDWVGSTSIRSEQYFSMLRRILKPDGVLVMNNYGLPEAVDATRAAVVRSFTHVYYEEGQSQSHLLVSAAPIKIDEQRAGAYLESMKHYFQEEVSEVAKRLFKSIQPLDREKYMAVEPIRDDFPRFEYKYKSLPAAFPKRRVKALDSLVDPNAQK